MNTENFDLVVIGGGPAGFSGAQAASIFGKRVALVEREVLIGGAGINSGTVPSKTLRETALALSGWRSRRLFGVDLSLRREATIGDFMHHESRVTATEQGRMEAKLRESHVIRFQGEAAFADPHTLLVTAAGREDVRLQGEKILIATGSSPWRPPEFDFEDDRIHDSDELLHLKAIPKRLAIVGAGVIGSEYACTFAAMGSEVHLIDGRDTLLPFLDGDISRELAAAMEGNGVRFHWKERATACDQSHPGEVRVTLTSGTVLNCDGLLVCAGRSSNTDALELQAAGITPGKRGLIPVDHRYRSEVPHIYAAGDVIGAPALASTSMEQARVAMCDAFGLLVKPDLSPILPSGIYTIPEASMVGETEEALRARGADYVVGRANYVDNARGQIVGDDVGFLKLLFDCGDMRLLGAHVLGEMATEVVHIGLMAMLAGEGAELLNRACFNFPTLGDLYKYATYDALIRREHGKVAAVTPP